MALRSYPVAFAPKARLDLLDIGDHIAQDSPAEARRFVARLTVQCQRIGRSPFGYASRKDLIAGLRMATISGTCQHGQTWVMQTQMTCDIERILDIIHGNDKEFCGVHTCGL